MIDDPTTTNSLHGGSADGPIMDRGWFVRAANWILRGALALGVLRGVETLLALAAAPDLDFSARLSAVAGACSDVVLYGVVGLIISAFIRALGLWADSTALAARNRLADSEVLLQALLAGPSTTRAEAPSRSAEGESHAGSAVQLTEIRRLIREGDWDAATEAVGAFRAEHPDDPRSAEASGELERAMQGALDHFESQLQAAREVNDPDQVLEIHGRLRPLIGEEERKRLDVDLARWFLSIVHRRLRSGRIQADVVALADRIAESFGHTTDGASLRASLPTLRRSAGLCPRCAKPYTGVAQACPECLKPTPAPPPDLEPDDLDQPPVEARAGLVRRAFQRIGRVTRRVAAPISGVE